MAQSVGPRVLAEMKQSIYVLLDYTGSLNEVPLDAIQDGLEASCRAVASDTRFSPTDSDTLAEPAVCEPLNAQTFGASNAEARLTVFRYADESDPGTFSEQFDDVYQALKEKGTAATIVIRDLGLPWDADLEVGQEIEVYRVTSDWPQKPQERTGYQKRTIPMAVSDFNVSSVIGEPADGGTDGGTEGGTEG